VTIRSRPLRLLWIWGPVALYLAGIFYLSSLSHIPWAAAYPDYLEHSLEYAGLALVLARGLNGGLDHAVPPPLLLLAFALCVGYGALDELHQYFVPDRLADWRDVLSDSAGSAAGLLALHLAGLLRAGRGRP
jgi:VanZ family protein